MCYDHRSFLFQICAPVMFHVVFCFVSFYCFHYFNSFYPKSKKINIYDLFLLSNLQVMICLLTYFQIVNKIKLFLFNFGLAIIIGIMVGFNVFSTISFHFILYACIHCFFFVVFLHIRLQIITNLNMS